jgi:hypothetical protein
VLGTTRAAGHAVPFLQWGDVPTWVLAALALGALIAAVLAYRKQADAASKLAEQVDLQRQQLADQQAANSKQARVLDAELRDLRQRAEAVERQQADAITFTPAGWPGNVPGIRSEGGPDVHMALVGNESHRPVKNAVACIRSSPLDAPQPAYMVGRMIKHLPMPLSPPSLSQDWLVDQAQNSRVNLLWAGETAAFVFPNEISKHPGIMTLRFTDDAGLHWEIDPDLHLEKLAERNW